MRKGETNSGSFKKGQTPWNKGKAWSEEMKQRLSDSHKGKIFNDKHHTWKGDRVGYRALHEWVERRLGKPSKCADCGTTTAKHYDWASISRSCKRDLSDWKRLCRSCHFRYDGHHEVLIKSRQNNPEYKRRISEAIKRVWVKRKGGEYEQR